MIGRDRDDHAVRRLRRRRQVGIAGQAENLGVPGIDREDPAAVAEALEIGDDARRAGHPLRSADDCDARGVHQGCQIDRAHSRTTIAYGFASVNAGGAGWARVGVEGGSFDHAARVRMTRSPGLHPGAPRPPSLGGNGSHRPTHHPNPRPAGDSAFHSRDRALPAVEINGPARVRPARARGLGGLGLGQRIVEGGPVCGWR